MVGRDLYPKQARIAIHKVYFVDDLPGRYRIFVPKLFPIVPEMYPKGITNQTRKGDLLRGKKLKTYSKKRNLCQ
jgi:hypothetical protein